MRKETILLSALICILVTGCFDNTVGPQKHTVYVAGVDNSLGAFPVAVYWKDGIRVPLGDSVTYSVATSIFVTAQNDVYVAGYYQLDDYSDHNFNTVAMLWKNGKAIPLTDGNNSAMAYAVTVSGSDVYVAGYEGMSVYSYAKYWKNGDPVVLQHQPLSYSKAKSIVVKNGDVYVAGYASDQYAYWKNGNLHLLPNTRVDSDMPVSIAIADKDDVYVACQTSYNGIPYFNYSARYWRDDIQYYLPTGAMANGMTVSSHGDVYVAGSKLVTIEPNNSFHVAKYWKNGKSVELADSTTTMSIANGIAVSGNDVYVAGVRDWSQAVYWRNGVEVPLTVKGHSFANAIFVR